MIRGLGAVCLVAGLLAATFFSVVRLDGVPWKEFSFGLGAALIGALLVRSTDEKRGGGMLILNVQIIRSSLTMLSAKLRNLDPAKRERLGVFEIRHFIDRHLLHDLHRFLGARETLIYKHGLSDYARVMDAFAAGERALNRAWSASADGYVDEVNECLERARGRFEEALALVEELEKR